jgi:predicted  nucleic acid-binding Zn-ribbon protein
MPPPESYPTPGQPAPYGTDPGSHRPAPSDCTKPVDQLKDLESTLQHRTAELAALTSQKDSLQKDLDALRPTVTDYSDKVTEYKEKCKDAKEKKSILDKYVADKGPMLEAAIKDKKPQILHCVWSVDNWITQWKQYADALAVRAKDADERSVAAATRAQEAQDRYDALKDTLAGLGALLEALNDSRKEIEAEEEKDQKLKTARMYVIFLELVNKLTSVKIRTPEEFEWELCMAWGQLSTAKSAAREAAAAATAAKDAATTAAAKYEENKGKRREKIFACIDKLCGPRPAPPAVSTGYTATPDAPA